MENKFIKLKFLSKKDTVNINLFVKYKQQVLENKRYINTAGSLSFDNF